MLPPSLSAGTTGRIGAVRSIDYADDAVTVRRAIGLDIAPTLDAVVCIPAKDEAERLPACLAAIAHAAEAAPFTCGVVVLINNSRDETSALVAEFARSTTVPIAAVDVVLDGPAANVAVARRLALDIGMAIAAPDAVLLSTDADTLVGEDWVTRMVAGVRAGAALVAGGIEVDPAELAALPPVVLIAGRVEAELLALYEALWRHIDPGRPCTMLQAACGANFAVSVESYLAVGGLPLHSRNEDRALLAAVRQAGLPVVVDPTIGVVTSCRLDARARNGMGDALVERCTVADPHIDERILPLRTFLDRALSGEVAASPVPALRVAAAEVELTAARTLAAALAALPQVAIEPAIRAFVAER